MILGYLRDIELATQPCHIREIFNRSYPFIREPDLHNSFFERIEFLAKRTVNAQEVRDYEELKEDIELEMEHGTLLRAQINRSKRQEFESLTPKETLLKALESKNELIKAIHSKNHELSKVTLSSDLINDEALQDKKGLVYKVEKELILKTLVKCDFNRTQAARALGISIRTLRNKLNLYVKENTGLKIPGINHDGNVIDLNTREEILN